MTTTAECLPECGCLCPKHFEAHQRTDDCQGEPRFCAPGCPNAAPKASEAPVEECVEGCLCTCGDILAVHMVTRAPFEPDPQGHAIACPKYIDLLHPNGRCTCGGEGRCEWCERIGNSYADDWVNTKPAPAPVDVGPGSAWQRKAEENARRLASFSPKASEAPKVDEPRCLPECERNCWSGQDKHAYGCPVAALLYLDLKEPAPAPATEPKQSIFKCYHCKTCRKQCAPKTGQPICCNCKSPLPSPQAEDGGKVACGACTEWDPSCEDCLRYSPDYVSDHREHPLKLEQPRTVAGDGAEPIDWSAELAAADQNLKTMLQAAGEEAARQLAEKDKRIEALETELALAVVPDDHEAEERAVLQASLAAAREEIAKLREWRHLEEFVRVEGTLAAEKARADKAEAEVARLTEKERMVDAAISVLSLSNTEKTLVENHLPRENPYWTVAQDDVARAIRREMWQRDRADKAEQRVRELEKAGWTVVKTRKPFDGILPLVESVKALEAILAREQKEGGR